MTFSIRGLAESAATDVNLASVVAAFILCVPLLEKLPAQMADASRSGTSHSFPVHGAVSDRGSSQHQVVLSTLEAPANSAEVRLQNSLLTIRANDSDLSQILRDISQQSGMKITGYVQGVRVFGSYGPEEPIDLLTKLLTGLSYNFVLIGTLLNGMPKELMLTPRTGTVTPPQAIQREEKPELGPGAIAHPKPEQDELPQIRVYQHDRRLHQIHEAMEQRDSQITQ